MTPEAQNIALAEACLDALIAKDTMTIIKHPRGTEGYRGTDLSGWCIYKRGDGSMYGTNWRTKEECRAGNIQELATRHNFDRDLSAQFEAWQKLTEEHKIMFGEHVSRIALRKGIREAEVQYRFGCECLLRALGKWIE